MADEDQHDGYDPRVENANGAGSFVLVCEHASARIPDEMNGLGLSNEARLSHIAWDPGALETARQMSNALDAPLVTSTISRLVYDCNRPPEAGSAIPEVSENTRVPGNAGLTPRQKAARVTNYYRPFEAALAGTLDHHRGPPTLVTIHSFTPVYKGSPRSVEIGILHDKDRRLADALLDVARGYDVRRNAPYGPKDGVTHTLCRHALTRGILNVMIEIRNDLIATPAQCSAMGDKLAGWLTQALESCAQKEAAQ